MAKTWEEVGEIAKEKVKQIDAEWWKRKLQRRLDSKKRVKEDRAQWSDVWGYKEKIK